ncbi:uncharacterized protein LOC122276458 [Carya illinoinensis]|uniref:DUF4378 domain-containing protein n=1 Tax=Carya illinoinensis TaxID=32201 RepID=A0A8T1PJP3_CARIL|nr:uncharacterized protein LOC122276458 [Carya illinoinensis]XP_042942125.1 uncharacterized protein LOC122276458 [Carya illinoinensis]KAG6643105.1 hypothetical protein CIPAW_09G187300 [Carya illinoinensis]
MDNFRQKRSKISGITDRSSGERFSSTVRAHREGNRQVQRERNFPKVASDSSSCSSGTADENTFTFELDWRSSKQSVGTPIKKLLAEEMSRETESKRRSPSVIAKLMGLDGLPPQQPVHRQQKKYSENYINRKTSVDRAQKSGRFYDLRSSSRNSKEEQEFKDVFEVLETSKMKNGNCSSQEATSSKLTDAEMEFIRQKFMDAKRLSSDQKLQDTKEFYDALEVLDSNKDRLLKYLQQPDLLFTKHLHDLRGAPPQTHRGRVAAVEFSDAHKHENSELGKSARRTPWKNYSRSPRKHCDGLFSHPDSRHAAYNALNSANISVEQKDKLATLPTSIVVLKPNIGKAQNGANPASSPCSLHGFLSDCGAPIEFSSVKNRKGDSCGMKNFPDRAELSRHKSRESREIAREITKQMRKSFRGGSMNFSSAGFRGYAGDESSCDISGNESEAITVDSRNSFDLSNQYKPSSSRSAESSVSREAKKRLSERWKMTHKSQEFGVVSKGNTLAEMLSVRDKDLTPANFSGVIGEDEISDKFASEDRPMGWVEPLGISSRDGWKDGSMRKLSRSRSLPASSTAFGSPKTSKHRETFYEDRYLMPNETLKKERSKRVKGKSDWREGSVTNKSRSSSKKSHSSSCTVMESNGYLAEIHTSQNQVKASLENINPSEKDVMILETSVSNVNNTSPGPENVVDVSDENTDMPSEPPDELLPDKTAGMGVKNDISAGGQDILILQEPSIGPSEEGSVSLLHPPPGLESPVSSKVADQPSPVSVLEAPFTDDLSSCSECFESLNADIHGLRMQLQLLKSESEAYAEGPMLISSDEDVGEGSILNEKGFCRTEETWEASYIMDVLNDSGFNDFDADTFTAMCHSSECPVDPSMFVELEKKYCSKTSCQSSERRLLFDQINSALAETYQQLTDEHPWARPTTRIGSKWIKGQLQDRLQVLLAGQEKKLNKDVLGKVLTRESQWLALGDDIGAIGREIEQLLTDELLAEVVEMAM